MAALGPYALALGAVAGYGGVKFVANRLWGSNDKPVDIQETAERAKRCQEKVAPIIGAISEGCKAIKGEEEELGKLNEALLELQAKIDERQKALDDLKEAVVYLSGVDTNNAYKLWWNRDAIEKAQRVVGRHVGREQMRRTFSGASGSSAPDLPAPFIRDRDMSLPASPTQLSGGESELIQSIIRESPDPYMQGSLEAKCQAVVGFLRNCRYNSKFETERTIWKNSEANKMTFLEAALQKYPEAERDAIKMQILGTGLLPMAEQQKIQQKMALAARQQGSQQ